MLVITGTIKVESESEVLRVRDALIRRAIRSRNDDGNIDYVFTQNLEDPTEIRLVEKWESKDALNAHLAKPDAEFDNILQTAKIVSAIVVCNHAEEARTLLQR